MLTKRVVVNSKHGLHARPADLFVKECQRYECDIAFVHGEKTGNAKSMLAVLTAGVGAGNEIELICDGPDEAAASASLEHLLLHGLPDQM